MEISLNQYENISECYMNTNVSKVCKNSL